jgi:hypothetical protein
MQTAAGVPWEHDYATTLERAKAERKLVLLDIFNPG